MCKDIKKCETCYYVNTCVIPEDIIYKYPYVNIEIIGCKEWITSDRILEKIKEFIERKLKLENRQDTDLYRLVEFKLKEIKSILS